MKPVISSVFLTTISCTQVLSEAGSGFTVVVEYPVSVPVDSGEGELIIYMHQGIYTTTTKTTNIMAHRQKVQG